MVYSYMGAKCRLKNVILKKDQVAKGDEKLQSDEKLQKVMKSCKRWWKMGENGWERPQTQLHVTIAPLQRPIVLTFATPVAVTLQEEERTRR